MEAPVVPLAVDAAVTHSAHSRDKTLQGQSIFFNQLTIEWDDVDIGPWRLNVRGEKMLIEVTWLPGHPDFGQPPVGFATGLNDVETDLCAPNEFLDQNGLIELSQNVPCNLKHLGEVRHEAALGDTDGAAFEIRFDHHGEARSADTGQVSLAPYSNRSGRTTPLRCRSQTNYWLLTRFQSGKQVPFLNSNLARRATSTKFLCLVADRRANQQLKLFIATLFTFNDGPCAG